MTITAESNTDSQTITGSLSGTALVLRLDNTTTSATIDMSGLADGDAWAVSGEDISSAIGRLGNVGIGTTSPTQKLDVFGAIMTSNSDGDKLYLTNQSGGSKIAHFSGWSFDSYAGPSNADIGLHRWLTGTNNGYAERMRIQQNGNVGIGTNAPDKELDVNGQLRVRTLSNTGIASHSIVVADGDGVLKTTTLSDIQDGTGTDDQKLSVPTPTDDTKVEIKLEDGGSVTLKEGNNIQLSQTRGTNEIVIEATASGGGTNTDNQNLSVNTATANHPVLQIERGSSVTFNAGTNVKLDATTNSITINAEDKQTINSMSVLNDKLKIGISGGNEREVDLSSLRAKLSAGSGVTISGSGTSASPYTIGTTGGGTTNADDQDLGVEQVTTASSSSDVRLNITDGNGIIFRPGNKISLKGDKMKGVITISSEATNTSTTTTVTGGDGDAWGVFGEDQTGGISRSGWVSIGTALTNNLNINPETKLTVNENAVIGKGTYDYQAVIGKLFRTGNDNSEGWVGLSNYQLQRDAGAPGSNLGGYFVNRSVAISMTTKVNQNADILADEVRVTTRQNLIKMIGTSTTKNTHLDKVSDGLLTSTTSHKVGIRLLNDYTKYKEGTHHGFYMETAKYAFGSTTERVLHFGEYTSATMRLNAKGVVVRQQSSGIATHPGTNGVFAVYGPVWKSGSSNTWLISSDRRIKDNIMPYQKGLSDLLKVNPVTYTYNEKAGAEDTSKQHVGIIAQDIEKVFPNTVTKADDTAGPSGLKDKRNFDNSELLYTLINAVKELKAENDALKERIEVLEKK